jgi:hypothetical protein
MSRWAAYLAYDVISDVAFGSPFDMLHAPTMRWIESALGKLTYRANVMGQFPELFKMGKAQGRWLNPTWWFFGRDLPKTRRYEGVGLAMAMKRTDKGYDSDRKDIMHFVLNAKDPETGEGFSKHEIWAESNLIIGGGKSSFPDTPCHPLHLLLLSTPTIPHLTVALQVATQPPQP